MRLAFLAALFAAAATPAAAQSVTCDPLCHPATGGTPAAAATPNGGAPFWPTGSNSSNAAANSTSAAQSRATSRANAQGAVNGSVNNGSLSSRSVSRGGSASVTVVNAVRAGGGGGGGWRRVGSPSPVAADPPPADPGPALGSAGNPLTENQTIGGTTTVRNVPEIVAPNISGGNPCLVGISGGGAGPGIGITLGIGYSDKGCERRNDAAVLNNLGQKSAAIELMCDKDDVRLALARAGQPCAADRAKQAVAATQVAAQSGVDAAVIRRQQAAAAPPPKPARPEWCGTASAEELRSHPQCDMH